LLFSLAQVSAKETRIAKEKEFNELLGRKTRRGYGAASGKDFAAPVLSCACGVAEVTPRVHPNDKVSETGILILRAAISTIEGERRMRG
jgi:hypothetical protein